MPFGRIHVYEPFSLFPRDRRMEQLQDYACTAGAWFSISMVPRKTDWIVMNNDRKVTALSYMDQPLSLWMVGPLQSLHIYIGAVSANPTLRLAVDFMRNVDRIAHADILRLVHRTAIPSASEPMRMWSPGGAEGSVVS